MDMIQLQIRLHRVQFLNSIGSYSLAGPHIMVEMIGILTVMEIL